MRGFRHLVAVGLFLAAPASAHDYAAKGLKIHHPWTRPAAAGMSGVGYLSITNASARADVLKAVEIPLAASASLHSTAMKAGVMSMRPKNGGLMITPGRTVTLSPGGDHIMMTGLKSAFVAGGSVPATLVFERAGRVPVEFTVETGVTAASGAHH